MPIKVFVGNLPENCSNESIRDLFAPYGDVKEVNVIKNFAFVHYENKDDADKAVNDLNKTKMFGHTIIVEVSKNQGHSGGGGGNRNDYRDNRRDNRDNRRGGRNAGDNRRGGGGNGGDRRNYHNHPNNHPNNHPHNHPNNHPNNHPLPLGGILGASPAPNVNPLGLGANAMNQLGIFSAVNTLAAVEQQVRAADLMMERERQMSPQPRDHEMQRDVPRDTRDDRMQPDPDVRVRREVVHTRDVPEARRMGLGDGYVIYERYYVDPNHPLLKGLPIPDLPRMTDSYVAPRDPSYSIPREPSREPPVNSSSADFRDNIRDRSPLASREDLLRERDLMREKELRARDYPRLDSYDRR